MTHQRRRRSIFSMNAGPIFSFDHAGRFFADLNQRQRDILRLIAEGRTNAEIASSFGMTLAGAKWNVSEILTKLGLDTREQAAAFYHWRASRHNRLRQSARAIAALVPFRVALAGGSGVVIAGVVIGLVIATHGGTGGDDLDSPGAPFYLEANVRRIDSQQEADQRAVWWYSDATHQRQEMSTAAIVSLAKGVPAGSISYGPSGVSTSVFDGTFAWSGGSTQYIRTPILSGSTSTQWRGSGLLGPLPDTSVDAFVARLKESAGPDTVKIVRTARVLGRDAVVVEQSPAPGTVALPRATRYWVDASRMFVMKSEIDSGDGNLRLTTTVTKLRYGESQDPTRFVLSPAPGAVEITCTWDPALGPTHLPPTGFIGLPPGSIPPGLVSTGVGTSAGRDGTCAEVHIQAYPPGGTGAPGEPFLNVGENREDAGSVLSGPRDDLRILQPGDVSSFAWLEGDVALLAWDYDGLGVQLKSNAMSVDELVALAEAMLAQ